MKAIELRLTQEEDEGGRSREVRDSRDMERGGVLRGPFQGKLTSSHLCRYEYPLRMDIRYLYESDTFEAGRAGRLDTVR
jgi:hypothetical protein